MAQVASILSSLLVVAGVLILSRQLPRAGQLLGVVLLILGVIFR